MIILDHTTTNHSSRSDPNAQQQQPTRVGELSDITDTVAPSESLASLTISSQSLVMAHPITRRSHDDHSSLSSSSFGDQITPLSSSNLGNQNSIQTTPSLKLGGIPTGTTITAVFDIKQHIRQANFFAAQRLERLQLLHHVKEKFPNWSYKACCNEAIEKYGLEAGDVNTLILKSRFR
jgi:hypothetical protein